jgi:hypothetical protein
MHIVQLFLPLRDNGGEPFGQGSFGRVRQELMDRFGGLTAFTQAPAEGLWKQEGEPAQRDQIVIFEVLVSELDEAWWHHYRRDLEQRFRQEEILIRALPAQRL